MDNKFKFSVITGSMGKIGDRYCLSGYKDDFAFEEKLKKIADFGTVSGIEIFESEAPGLDGAGMAKLLAKYNLEPSSVLIDLWGDRKWKSGTITSKDPSVRQAAVNEIKCGMNYTEACNTEILGIWLGQDGFDYPLQVDYEKQWEWAVECLCECADYNRNIKISIEPKMREPRARCFVDSASTALLLVNDVNRDNVGITLDVGHVLQENKNMSQAVANVQMHNKLFNIHINDNYGAWDDDMIVGAVRLPEYIELFYILDRMGYDKYISIDIFPYREDSLKAAEESLKYMKKYTEMLAMIGVERIEACLQSGNACEAISLIRESVFK